MALLSLSPSSDRFKKQRQLMRQRVHGSSYANFDPKVTARLGLLFCSPLIPILAGRSQGAGRGMTREKNTRTPNKNMLLTAPRPCY